MEVITESFHRKESKHYNYFTFHYCILLRMFFLLYYIFVEESLLIVSQHNKPFHCHLSKHFLTFYLIYFIIKPCRSY